MDVNRCIDDFDPDFEYTDVNTSHSWLFSYPGKLLPEKSALTTSTTKETFVEPQKKTLPKQGKRKKLLEHFYRQIIAEEIKAELGVDTVNVEPYETDYSDHYKNPDDMPIPGECLSKNEKIKKDATKQENRNTEVDKIEELKKKYPLYTSRPFSFAAQNSGRDQFGIKTTISKPPEKNYDNIEY